MAASNDRTKGDGKLRHPADGKQWKHFDAKFPKEFGDEARNVRFPQHLASHPHHLKPTSLAMSKAQVSFTNLYYFWTEATR
jgi:hypothetical protein